MSLPSGQKARLRPRELLRAGLLVALTFGGGAALAQSSSGSIYGAVDPGDKVVIKNQESGLTREEVVGEDGKFNFTMLPTGTYLVSREKDGNALSSQTARVNAGVGTAVSLVDELNEVVVSGTALSPIDTTTSQVSVTFTAAQLRDLPINQNVIDIALLAPGTSRGSSGANDSSINNTYNNLASFGGSSIAENQYYVNGFNVTNLFRNIEYSKVPFYAMASEQVLTGGYGPEYGLSTGGVVNINTMKGTNQWQMGSSVDWMPKSLRAANGKRTFTSDGSAYRDYSKNTDDTTKYDLWGGGPIVEDKLFIFGIVEISDNDVVSYPKSYSTNRNVWNLETKEPFALVKLDWNINDKNLIEMTGIKDETKYTNAQYTVQYDSNGFVTPAKLAGTDINKRGGWIGVGKYTGYFTDELTFSAQYGQLNSKRQEYQYAADGTYISYNGVIGDYDQPGCPYVVYAASWKNANTGLSQPACYVSSTIDAATGKDTRKAGRVDLQYKVPQELLGSHTVQGGYDWDRWSSFYGNSYSGGTYYSYNTNAAYGNYVRVRHFQTGASAGVHSTAFYLKDDWQFSNNLLFQIGLRNDSFENLNGAGEKYLTQDNIWQPRFGVAWDPSGDSTKKVYGSYGIYSLPVTSGISIRGASASIYSTQFFHYSAIDPVTGAATLTDAVGPPLAYINGENGTVPAAGTFAATNLDPTQQSEFIVGYQQELPFHLKGGARFTYRNLLKTIDDMCDSRPFDSWAARTGFTGGTANIDANVPCFVINPGYGANINYDVDGDGTLESTQLTADDIGLPKARRKYIGMEFTLEKPWADQWYSQFSYTWSHNYGNGEGLADSDNAQLDIGTTLAFDFPELMVGAYGDLPNDHRHTVKAVGAYKLLSQWMVSGSLLVQSGKPKNCIGSNEAVVDSTGYDYGAAYFYCNGQVVPRGSVGRTATLLNVDMGLTYTPDALPGLNAMVSVYNIFNRHGETSIAEGYTDDQGALLSSYGASYSFQTPRYVQLSARYNFNLQ